MKKTILSLLLTFGFATAAQADASTEVMGWDTALPQAEKNVVNMIQTFALENYYLEVHHKSCGGETGGFELTNYYTFESFTGELTHKIKVRFLVTGSYNYCEGEVVYECEAPLTLHSPDHVSMGKTRCTVVQLP